MPQLLRMPEIAANTTSAVLSSWSVAENVPFAAGDVLATVETEKAVVEVEADTGGVILRRLVGAGTEVEVGTAVAVLGSPGDSGSDVDRFLEQAGLPPATGERSKDPGTPEVTRRFASPLARRLAREAGLPLDRIVPTGPNGRIVRRDVEAALRHGSPIATAGSAAFPPPGDTGRAGTAPADDTEHRDTAPPGGSDRAGTAPPGDTDRAGTAPGSGADRARPAAAATVGRRYTDTPASRQRQAIARRLSGSKATVPHFYLRGTASVERLLSLRAEINDGADTRVSLNDILIKAVATAHTMVPEMNVIWTGDAVRRFTTVDVGVAIATDAGLVTPVLPSAENATVTTIARATQDFAARARSGRLRQAELEGGVITVTNLGMFGTDEFAAIINPPQSAILAVGAARPGVIAKDGAVAVATTMTVTLSVDHRPIDGVVAAEWMRTFISLLERPIRLLA